MRIICPQCRGKLSIHRPSVAATRVKCRNCGHKFYAGKADEVLETAPVVISRPSESEDTQAEPQVAVVTAPAEIAFDEELKADQRAEQRERVKERQRRNRAKWLIPVGIVGLAAMIAVGITFSRKVPQIPNAPTTSPFEPSNMRNQSASFRKTPSADSGAFMNDGENARRPEALIGVWTLQDPSGGVIELRADGSARVHGPMIDSAVMELDTQWFVIKFEGKEYMIDFGLEPYRNENCIATVRLQPDGQLKLIRFDNPRGRNFTPRMFKKSG